jgi:hypothetical protein
MCIVSSPQKIKKKTSCDIGGTKEGAVARKPHALSLARWCECVCVCGVGVVCACFGVCHPRLQVGFWCVSIDM